MYIKNKYTLTKKSVYIQFMFVQDYSISPIKCNQVCTIIIRKIWSGPQSLKIGTYCLFFIQIYDCLA